MNAKPNMHVYEFPGGKTAQFRYQSSLFNNSLQLTAVELSNTQTQPSEVFEQSMKQQILQETQPMQLESSRMLAGFKLQPSSTTEEEDVYSPKQQFGEDKRSQIAFDAVSPLQQQQFQSMKLQMSRKLQNRFGQTLRVRQQFQIHNGPVWSCEFSPDASFLVTGGRDAVVKVFKFNKSSLLQCGTVLKERDYVLAAQNATHLPAGLSTPPFREFHGHVADIVCISINVNNHILTASLDQTVRVWHHLTPYCLGSFKFPSQLISCAWDCSVHDVFYASDLGAVYRYDLKKHEVLKVRQENVIFLGSNQQFLFCVSPKIVVVRNKHNLSVESSFQAGHGQKQPPAIMAANLSRSLNELILITDEQKCNVKVYSAWSGTLLQTFSGAQLKKYFKPQQLQFQQLQKLQLNIIEGPVERSNESCLFVLQKDSCLFSQFISCPQQQKKLKVKKFQQVAGYKEIECQSLVQFKLNFEPTASSVLSVENYSYSGGVTSFQWGFVIVGMDGCLRFFDII